MQLFRYYARYIKGISTHLHIYVYTFRLSVQLNEVHMSDVNDDAVALFYATFIAT